MILLDTHAWIWWANRSQKLSVTARREIESESELGVPVISCWEVGMLVEKRRLKLDREIGLWVRQALALPGVVLMPLTPEIAVASTVLPADFQGDPADWMIVATAMRHDIAVLTKDQRICDCKLVTTIW